VARLRRRLGLQAWIELPVRGELLVPELDGTLAGVWALLGGIGGHELLTPRAIEALRRP